ncbi:MAG: FAD-dependent monooxygenase [Actinobacteria bacterium]|nr:FAD-dependent monooxygenase [Actinomycetota bacterium]MCA1721215.1 FAD-dependent monooxygenase [Actinomycetota bacterium]
MSDVVIVGGGIAGSSLAVLLARAGVGATVLERTLEYEDRVRGETMPPWGYLELVKTGLLEVFLRAEGTVMKRSAAYGDVLPAEVAQAAALDVTAVLPGAEGFVNLSHPGACQALLDEAAAAGAQVVRGVRGIEVTPGEHPEISFRAPAGAQTLRPRLVVGADGRSSVVRKQIGVELEHSGVRTFASGVLLDGVARWPRDTNAVGTWGDVHFLVFPRGADRARLYLIWDKEQPQRFVGPGAPARMVEQMAAMDCFPEPDWFAAARPVSSCASYPMEDTWTDRPYAPGVALIGDAAGWNDPVIGQGLSIAVRDVRLVADALLGTTDWSPATFGDYATERTERMRRLRATAEAATRLRCDFTPAGRQRRIAAFGRFAADPAARLPIAAALVGPELLPAEAFTREAADRMLALT